MRDFFTHQMFRLRALRTSTRLYSTPANALTQIEARWTKLPEAEQGAIADKLYDLQKGDWKKMTLEEKRAGIVY
jgi:cytochrome c oxidase subunit 4